MRKIIFLLFSFALGFFSNQMLENFSEEKIPSQTGSIKLASRDENESQHYMQKWLPSLEKALKSHSTANDSKLSQSSSIDLSSIETLLHASSARNISSILISSLGYRESDFGKIESIKDYSAKLLEKIYADPPLKEAVDSTVTFSSKKISENLPYNPTNEFYEGAFERIYVWFKGNGNPVIAKWINNDRNEIILTQRFSTSKSGKQYVWYTPTDSWKHGRYSVEIYDLYSLEELGRGGFTVN